MRRAALLVLALLAGCGGSAVPAARPTATPWASTLAGPDDRAPKSEAFDTAARAQAERAAALRAAIAEARASATVEGALRVARLTGHITAFDENRGRREWANAQATLARLTGVRHDELAYVVGAVGTLAAQHALTADRLDPTFLILRANTSFWARAPMPASGFRTSFGRDPAIFQYYPGHGMQFQPLASWGRANALAGACLHGLRSGSRKNPCRKAALTTSLDRLAGLAARRNGYVAWEYYFAYRSGTPPWVSGMTQATAAQALSRGYRALGKKRWRRTALRALGAFEQPPPAGVSVAAPGGRHYLLYSFSPGYRVLNGNLQALIGLRDAGALTHSARAKRLFRRGDGAARRAVAGFDTGAWSLYSARGAESTLNYHVLVAGFLDGLCNRVKAKVYCSAGRRFRRYEHEPTKIGVSKPTRPRANYPTQLRFTLSKVSSVKVRIWGTRGLSLSRDLQLPRGGHSVPWSPPGRGRFHVRIEAQGPSGPVGVAKETIRVIRPKPKPKKHKKRHRDHVEEHVVTVP